MGFLKYQVDFEKFKCISIPLQHVHVHHSQSYSPRQKISLLKTGC